MAEQIWFKDPQHFMTSHSYNIFFPSSEMNFVQQLNSLMRLSIYFCVIVFIVKQEPNIFFVLIFMGIFTFLLYSIDAKNTILKQSFLDENNLDENKITHEECMKPSNNNPFMNVLMSEYVDKPERPKACDVTIDKTNKMINTAFEYGLYRDVNDVFSKSASDRQYVTNPSTTIPNDREKLTDWLYKSGSTCKEGNGPACYNLQYSPLTPT